MDIDYFQLNECAKGILHRLSVIVCKDVSSSLACPLCHGGYSVTEEAVR